MKMHQVYDWKVESRHAQDYVLVRIANINHLNKLRYYTTIPKYEIRSWTRTFNSTVFLCCLDFVRWSLPFLAN